MSHEITVPTEEDTILFQHGSQSSGGVVKGWAYRRPGVTRTLVYAEMRQYPAPPDPKTFHFHTERKLGPPTVIACEVPGRSGMHIAEAYLRGIIEAFEAVVHEAEAKYPTEPIALVEDENDLNHYSHARGKSYECKRDPMKPDPYRVEMES